MNITFLGKGLPVKQEDILLSIFHLYLQLINEARSLNLWLFKGLLLFPVKACLLYFMVASIFLHLIFEALDVSLCYRHTSERVFESNQPF